MLIYILVNLPKYVGVLIQNVLLVSVQVAKIHDLWIGFLGEPNSCKDIQVQQGKQEDAEFNITIGHKKIQVW